MTYTYDELDRVNLAKLNSNDVAAYTFQGPGRVNTRTLYANSSGGNPVTTDVTYDGNARIIGLYTNPISKTNGYGGVAFNMSYDRANNLIREFALIEAVAGIYYNKDLGTDFYFYDSAYRVIGERRGVPGLVPPGFAGNNTAGNPPTGAAADQRTWLLDGVTNRPEETTQIGAGTPTTLNRTINSVNEYTQVGATSRSHDRNGNLIDDGTFLYTYDPLNRLVGVKSISSGAAVQTNVYDCKGRRVGKTDSDKYRYTYAGMSLIDESVLTGGEYRQYLLGGRGERFKVRQTTGPGGSVEEFLYIEKLDGSVVAHVNASREMVAYYDYRLQGTVEAFDPGTDGEFFSADDGVMAVDSVRGSYFANGNRFDVETGLINQEDSTRFIDPVNWRKLQPSVDMWVWSDWGLRYNSPSYFDLKPAQKGGTVPGQLVFQLGADQADYDGNFGATMEGGFIKGPGWTPEACGGTQYKWIQVYKTNEFHSGNAAKQIDWKEWHSGIDPPAGSPGADADPFYWATNFDSKNPFAGLYWDNIYDKGLPIDYFGGRPPGGRSTDSWRLAQAQASRVRSPNPAAKYLDDVDYHFKDSPRRNVQIFEVMPAEMVKFKNEFELCLVCANTPRKSFQVMGCVNWSYSKGVKKSDFVEVGALSFTDRMSSESEAIMRKGLNGWTMLN